MVVNDDDGNLTPRGALWCIASRLAPTGVGARHCSQAKKNGAPTKRTVKAVKHTTTCRVRRISPAAPTPRRCIPECGPSRRS
ncbi:hypothetical protein DKY63_13630 [Pseudomonas putida]|uniref:Uncharacterized protein n=1 Tax=Pseudomonas putida TaxID=303 RepID=A0A2Z4RJ01_PSEPU|nr:hypothetical protein DKY63_13630 [Pseudomonas putida]